MAWLRCGRLDLAAISQTWQPPIKFGHPQLDLATHRSNLAGWQPSLPSNGWIGRRIRY